MNIMNIQERKGGRGGGGVTWSCKKTSMACERTASCVIKRVRMKERERKREEKRGKEKEREKERERWKEGTGGGALHGVGKRHQWPATAQQVVLQQHTATHCNTLQHAATLWGVTWSWKKASMACERTASCVIKTSSFSPFASDLMSDALSCHADVSRSCNIFGRVSVLQCVAVRCSALQCVAVCYSAS